MSKANGGKVENDILKDENGRLVLEDAEVRPRIWKEYYEDL